MSIVANIITKLDIYERHATIYDMQTESIMSNPVKMKLSHWYRRFLKIIFGLLQCFGLFLPTDYVNFATFGTKGVTFRKVYSILWTLLLICGYVFLALFGSSASYQKTRMSSKILNILVDTARTIICVITVLGNAFWNQGEYSQYLKLQNILKHKMHLKKIRRKKYVIILEFLLGHIAFLIVVVIDQYKNVVSDDTEEEKTTQVIITVIRGILYYYIYLITIVIYNSALFLRNDFIVLKTFLTNSVLHTNGQRHAMFLFKPVTNMITPTFFTGENSFNKLFGSSKIINILFECVEIFNQIFGLVVVLLNFSTVLTILSSLNNLLVSGDMDELSAGVISDCLCQFIIFVIWNSFVISACGLLNRESENVVNLCCKLQHLLPQESKERKEFLNLARQVSRKMSKISAAGFFVVDFSLIFSVFTYVGTYTVVLIQFSHIDF